MKKFWELMYRFWPGVLRVYEIFFHNHRQKYLIGHLAKDKKQEDLKNHLLKNGFEIALIALKDPGEILNMRKREGKEFQYHIRIFDDGEIRGHYEYAPEAHPITHCFNVKMEERREYFEKIFEGWKKSL